MKSHSIETKQEVNHQPETMSKKENRTMRLQFRIVTLSLLAILCLAAAVLPHNNGSAPAPTSMTVIPMGGNMGIGTLTPMPCRLAALRAPTGRSLAHLPGRRPPARTPVRPLA